MKVGDTAYVRLEGFDPEWRQAVIVTARSGGELLLAVRVSKSELALQSFSSFEIASDSGTFILVEGDRKRLRSTCPYPHRSLEVEPRKLLTNARVLQEEDPATFATASEDLPKEPKAEKLNLGLLDEDSQTEESSEGSDNSGEGVLRLLKKAGKLQRDRGIPGAERSGRSKSKDRYPLLETQKKSQSLSLLDRTLEELVPKGNNAASSSQQMDVNSLIQLELLRELKGRGRSKKSRSAEEEYLSSSSRADSSSVEGEKLRGAGKALKAFRQKRKQKRRNPLKYVRRYVREVEDQLGVVDNSAYKLIDYTRRLQWGKFKTLMRFHYALSEVLQELLRGKAHQAALQVTQLLRATHQVALDNGEWKTAWLLLDLPDPVEKPRFGGEVQDLETVAAYVRAMHDLEKRSKTWKPPAAEDEEGAPAKGKGKRGKNRNGKGDKAEEKVDA